VEVEAVESVPDGEGTKAKIATTVAVPMIIAANRAASRREVVLFEVICMPVQELGRGRVKPTV
jgi:hypothetical protein